MFHDNLISLRKMHRMSQEDLSEQIGVTRQTLSKYETGESLPDIDKCKAIADVFGVSMEGLWSLTMEADELVNYEDNDKYHMGVGPKGKYMFGLVKVGDKGQIVIPAKARKVCDINPGDNLIVLGDEDQGMAIVKEKGLLDMLNMARKKK